jgi:hypothetical protein
MEKFTLGRTGSKSWLGEWVALRLGHEPEIERTLGERTPRLAAVRDEQSRTSPTAIDYADIPYQLSQPFLRRADEFGIIRISA